MVSGGERGWTTAGGALGGPSSCFVVAVGASHHQLSSDEHSSTGCACLYCSFGTVGGLQVAVIPAAQLWGEVPRVSCAAICAL